MYVCSIAYIYIHTHTYIYIYIYKERERESFSVSGVSEIKYVTNASWEISCDEFIGHYGPEKVWRQAWSNCALGFCMINAFKD